MLVGRFDGAAVARWFLSLRHRDENRKNWPERTPEQEGKALQVSEVHVPHISCLDDWTRCVPVLELSIPVKCPVDIFIRYQVSPVSLVSPGKQ